MATDKRYKPFRTEYDLYYAEPFVPRREPRDAPTQDSTSAPGAWVRVNAQWLPHLIGYLQHLTMPDAWYGDDATKIAAQRQAERLIEAMVNGMGIIQSINISGCDLIVTYTDGTTDTYDLSTCAVPGPAGPPGQDGTTRTIYDDYPPPTDPANPDQQTAGESLRCGTAFFLANEIRDAWQDSFDFVNGLSTGVAIGGAAIALAGILLPEPSTSIAGVGAFISLVGLLLDADSLGAADFTDQIRDEIAQAVYCAIGDDGVLPDSVFDGLIQQLEDDNPITYTVRDAIAGVIRAIPYEVWRGRAYAAPLLNPAGCASFTCPGDCTLYDFTINQQGWYTEGAVTAVYNAGLGWSYASNRPSRIAIILDVPGPVIVKSITVNLSAPMNGGLRDAQLYIGNTLSLHQTVSVGGATQFQLTPDINATRFQVYLRNDPSGSGLAMPGRITSIEVCTV